MDSRKSLTLVLAALLVALFLPAAAMAQPAVSVECAYSDVDLVCEVYVNTDSDQLRSGGVKLGYNASELLGPGGTDRPVAEKNGTDWFFTGTDYMDPETDTNGEVVFIVGKLDLGATGVGVNGTRVLVGKVTFTRATNTLPIADPAATFGISAGLGRVAPYVNFVNVGGANLDVAPPDGDGPVGFTVQVFERGDANGSGTISFSDVNAVKFNIGNPDAPIWVDCNKVGGVTFSDVNCVKFKIP